MQHMYKRAFLDLNIDLTYSVQKLPTLTPLYWSQLFQIELLDNQNFGGQLKITTWLSVGQPNFIFLIRKLVTVHYVLREKKYPVQWPQKLTQDLNKTSCYNRRILFLHVYFDCKVYEAAWNLQSRGRIALKITCVCLFVCLFVWLFVFNLLW